MTDKIYCGSGKEITTKYGTMMKLGFTADDLAKMQANLENGWVNLVVSERREKVEGKPTHYCTIDTWKPTQQPASTAPQMGEDDEPLPF